MAIEYNFTLDMDRSKRDNNIAYARTGDMDSIVINADLVFGGAAYTPSGENAFFECITPNGRSIRSAAEKTGSSVTVEVPPAAFQAAGVINVAYFRFESGEAGNPTYVESTEPFAIVVREGIGDSIDAGDYIEDWRKLVDHLEVVVADVGQKAEQVEIAKAAAEKAKADAETAGTAAANSALEAKSSATAAQQSATAAAESAKSVADKFISSAEAETLEPGSEATASVENQVLTIGVPRGDKGDKGDKGDPGTGVPDGGTPGQLLSKTDSGTAWVDPPSTGNVLVGEAEGYVAHAEDAYAQKPIEVRIKGKTRANLWVNPSGTSNGITVTANEDGSITISGTSMANSYIYSTIYSLKPGSTYTLSIDKTVNVNISIQPYDNSDGFIINVAEIGGNGASKNTGVFPKNAAYARLKIQCPPGTSISGTYRIMLNEGSEPEPWCPPGLHGMQTGNLVTSGKNLIDTNGASVLQGNFGVKLPNLALQPGSYVVKRPSGLTGNFAIYREGDTSASVSNITEAGTSFTLTSPIYGLDFRSSVADQITLDNISQFQLELGSTATAYEPPTVTETPLPEVELRGLPNGTCDELVIKADGTCEVERRTYSYTATGEEDVSYASGRAYFAVPGIMQFGFITLNIVCDKLATVNNPANATGCCVGTYGFIWFNVLGTTTDVKTSKAWLATNKPTFISLKKDMEVEPQSPVTLPALPAPTFNQYHDADVPSDMSTEYVRDINIVLDNLAKQVASTASAVAVREASTIEEE